MDERQETEYGEGRKDRKEKKTNKIKCVNISEKIDLRN